MATERYIIEIQEKGSQKTARSIQDIGKSAQQANSFVDILKTGLGLLGGVLAARKIIEYADAVTNLRNRLNLVTQSTDQTRLVTKELFDIAAATRSDFESTGQVYTRLALSAKSLGFSQTQLLQVTKSLNQAVILSGTNSREAANGLIQLSQAIASNRLGGDELRSVLEQLPLVADIIGAQLVKLGIAVRGTRGEVRQLGFDGKITADIIIQAMLNAADTLEKQFAGTIPTIGQALEVLSTRTIQFIANINDATGASQFLARAIILVADNLDTVARIVSALGIVTVLASAAKFATLLASSLGGLPIAILGAAVALLVTFSDKITISQDGAVRLSDALIGGFSILKEVFLGAYDALKSFVGLFDSGKGAAVTFFGFINSALDVLASSIDFVAQKLSLGLLKGGAVEALNAAREIARIEADKRAAQEAVQKQVDEIEKKRLAEPGTKAPPIPTKEEQKRAETLAKINAQLDAQARILLLTNGQREIENDLLQIENQLKGKLTATEEAVIRGKLISLQQLKDEAEVLDELQGPQENYERRLKALNDLYEQGKISLGDYNTKLLEAKMNALELDKTLEGGLQKGFIQIEQQLSDVASVAQEELVNAFDAANEALLNFVVDGTASIQDLEKSILRSFSKIALAQVESGLFGNGAGGAGGFDLIGKLGGLIGGLFGSSSTPAIDPNTGAAAGAGAFGPGFANGGSFMVGGAPGIDRNLVAFRASRGERVTVEPPGGAAAKGSAVNVVFNIQTPDAESFQRSQGQILTRTSAALERARRRNA